MGTYHAWSEWMGHRGKTEMAWRSAQGACGRRMLFIWTPCPEDSPRAFPLHCVLLSESLREHYALAIFGGKNSKYLLELGY